MNGARKPYTSVIRELRDLITLQGECEAAKLDVLMARVNGAEEGLRWEQGQNVPPPSVVYRDVLERELERRAREA